MTFASFFSGIGGFDLGFEKAGMSSVFQCEIDPFCQAVLKKHWPNVQLEGDISRLTPKDIPACDVWCGGFPCQDISLANQGKRRGLSGERSGLFFNFASLLEGKKKSERPDWIVLENVPGLLNSNHGEDLRLLLQTLDDLGYCVSWRVLDSKYFGTPQRRRRVFIVGSYRTLLSPLVLFDTHPDLLTSAQGGIAREQSASELQIGPIKTGYYLIQHASIGRKPSAGPQAKGYRCDGEAYTLDSRGGADAVCSPDAPFRVRKTPRFPSGMDGHRYRALGNAVTVPILTWIGTRILSLSKTQF